MEAEHFSMNQADGGNYLQSKVFDKDGKTAVHFANTPEGYKNYGVYLMGKSARWVARWMVVALVIYVALMLTQLIPQVQVTLRLLKILKSDGKSGFTQKENLQWLGGSTNVIRGDYENKQDSLAEKAARETQRVTDMSAPKGGFLSRELYSSPEEEAMRKLQAGN